MSNSHFAKFPQINLPRSRMKLEFNHKLSMMHGYLTPIDCFPVVPGDTHVMKKIASLVHMSTPIVPFMDNIDMYVRCFFIPLRLLWRGSSVDDNSFEKFMGANKGAGYQQTVPVFPACNFLATDAGYTKNAQNLRLNLSHMLGKPVQTFRTVNTDSYSDIVGPKALSVLKERGYYFIWNEYFRAEQLQGEEPVDYGDGFVVSGGGINFNMARVLLTDANTVVQSTGYCWNHILKKVNKKHDFFTSCTIAPQYGPSTLLPMQGDAPIYIENKSNSDPIDALEAIYPTAGVGSTTYQQLAAGSGNKAFLAGMDTTQGGVGPVYADLSQATAASINSLRFAFAVQRYLERSNYGSNHFYEILAVHYGVTSPDARLQRPEYLGGFHYRINVDQVLNATGKTDTDQTQLGQKGAVSVTADRHFGFEKGFVEPGYIYILAYTKQDRTYSDMVLTEDIKTNRFEFYSPEFANIGDREVLRFELDGKATSDDVFGYQEAWAEYRYRPSRCSADLNPSVSGSMPYWTLADSYALVPQLGSSWIEEDRTAVARALVTGVNGPDFLCDWYYEDYAARLMPVYSIPGLIDQELNKQALI